VLRVVVELERRELAGELQRQRGEIRGAVDSDRGRFLLAVCFRAQSDNVRPELAEKRRAVAMVVPSLSLPCGLDATCRLRELAGRCAPHAGAPCIPETPFAAPERARGAHRWSAGRARGCQVQDRSQIARVLSLARFGIRQRQESHGTRLSL